MVSIKDLSVLLKMISPISKIVKDIMSKINEYILKFIPLKKMISLVFQLKQLMGCMLLMQKLLLCFCLARLMGYITALMYGSN